MTLLLLSGCATQSAEKTYRQITMDEAITMMDEESQQKLQDTMKKIVNDNNGGLVCIIL